MNVVKSVQEDGIVSIDIQWGNPEKTFIAYTSKGQWTWEEFYAAVGKLSEMAKSIDDRIAVIMDLRESVPAHGNALVHFRNAMRTVPENVTSLIFVGAVGFKGMLISMASKVIFPRPTMKFHFVGSLDEARKLAAQLREPYNRIESKS